jgi:hypothetical protein
VGETCTMSAIALTNKAARLPTPMVFMGFSL